MHEDIIDFLYSRSQGTTSSVIAQTFLKFKSPDENLAFLTVKSILKNDPRCFCDENKRWFARKKTTGLQKLSGMPWLAVYLITGPAQQGKSVHYISLWNPLPVPSCIKSVWIRKTSELNYDEQQIMLNHNDSFAQWQAVDTIQEICKELKSKTALFFSYNQLSALSFWASTNGIPIGDNFYLLSQFMKILDLPLSKPLDLYSSAKTVLSAPVANDMLSAYKQGELFADIASELIEKLEEHGLGTLGELDEAFDKQTAQILKNKMFTTDDLAKLPQNPGVYGFKNSDGVYIYIGKAANLKKRIQAYFRQSGESPLKLQQLREDAHSYTIHLCGSELEALLYEYRLIKKYSPVLNRQKEISERKGEFSPIDDCIVLLPHAQTDKGISFWFREGQKIKIVPFCTDFSQAESIKNQLEEFFFSPQLPKDQSDFPEQEIAFRWIKKNRDKLISVPVSRYADSQEIFAAIKSYWKDVQGIGVQNPG